MGIKVYAETGKLIHIGRQGENLATEVLFDVSSQLESLGNNGDFTLLIFQEGELIEEGINLVENTTYCRWDITSVYTLKEEKGKCQIVYKVGDKISKTEIYDMIVTFGYIDSTS